MPNFGDDTRPTSECAALMAGLAAATERVRIGSLVFGNTYRHPAILANEVATIDHMSGGRVLLGLGAGWQENEHQAYGIELPPVKQRLDRFEEAVQVVKGLFSQPRFSFKGTYYVIDDAPMNPGREDMKILVGGSGEKRTMRIAAQYGDEWNAWSTPEIMRAKLDVLRRHCDALGRDFDDDQGVHPGAHLHERRRVRARRDPQGGDADAHDDRNLRSSAPTSSPHITRWAWTSSSSPTSRCPRREARERTIWRGSPSSPPRSAASDRAVRRPGGQTIGTTGRPSASSWWRYSLMPVPVRPS